MSSIIRIKRSAVSGNPGTLAAGELAYSALADNGSNGGDRLYVGMGTETAGNAANHVVIGGKYFTDMLDQSPGVLTASSAIIVDSSKRIDDLFVDNLELNGNSLSTTNANGDLFITPNGTGKTVVSNLYIGDISTPLAEYIYDTVGGAITAGTGITLLNSDASNTSTISIANTAVTSGSYGSASQIPTFTVNAQGQLTAAGSVAISTALGIAGDTGTDTIALGADTLTFVGGVGITSIVNAASNNVTFDIDATVATLTGAQTLTNKTINLTSNTLTATSAQLAAAITDETGSGSLVFATSPTLVTPNIGAATATSITGISGNISITAAAGNNNINLVPTGTGTVDVGSKRITALADPAQATDAATKSYVDAVKTGLNVKDAARVATTTALTATYANGTNGVGATLVNATTQAALTIDSIILAVNDRVLVKNQASAFQNGIYLVTDVGSASTNWILTRTIDADNTPAGEIAGGDFIFIQDGTINADSGFVVTTNGLITIGTTSIDWVQFSGAGQISAGNGLTKTGNTIDAVGTANRITVAADSIDIASTYVGQTSITTLGTIASGTWQAGIIAGQYGGTGVANTGKTITIGGNFTTAGAFTTTLTATANTTLTLPVTGTLATLAGAEAVSNKTITASSFSGTTLAASGTVTFTSVTDATALGTASTVLSGGLSIAKSMFIGTNIVGSGAATSALDGFSVDGGTY